MKNSYIFNYGIFTYNHLIRFYNRAQKKLLSLTKQGKNLRKQDILKKRLVRLYKNLKGLQCRLKLGMVTAALSAGFILFQPDKALGQITFGPLQNNPFGLIDVGYNSSPEFVDLDLDGDKDMMTDNGGYDGSTDFIYFENTGTATDPVFTTILVNPFGLTGGTSPALADLDNDGDLDLMVVFSVAGIYKFKYFQNIGTPVSPEFAAFELNPFGLTDEVTGSPTFVDLDYDGDMDLMCGESGGNFKYFQNIGTISSPSFAPVIINPFGLVDIGYNSKPAFVDLDNDGDFDMISGECIYWWYNSNFKYFENIGNVSSPLFDGVVTNPFGFSAGAFANPTFVDLDSDGDMDFMSGEFYGDFSFFENITTCIPSTETCNSLDDDCNGLIDDGISETISISAGGTTTFCQGGNVLLTATYSGATVQWKKNGVNITGAISPTLLVSSKGNYTCETSSNCDTILSGAIFINVQKNPPANISAGGATTFCAGGSVILTANAGGGLSYQWYKGASLLVGATSINYTATIAGNYKCRVTKTATGCFKNSNSIAVSVPCKEGEQILDNNISIYPNPASNTITIETNNTDNKSIFIVNAIGQIVQTINSDENLILVDINNLSVGLYFVKINYSDISSIKMFLKE